MRREAAARGPVADLWPGSRIRVDSLSAGLGEPGYGDRPSPDGSGGWRSDQTM